MEKKKKVEINPTFHFKKKAPHPEEQTPQYLEYRRKWEENPQKHIVGRVPIHMDLESTSVCNLKCITCFQSFDPPKPGFMKMELFKKIIDEAAAKGLCSIKLNFRGEPLINPDTPKMVKYAKQKGIIEVMFNSNTTLLTEKIANELIDAGLDKINCSVDACIPEVYERIRVGAKFDTILNNIKNLQRIKKERGVSKPIVRVQMVDSPVSHDQVGEFIKFWEDIADQVAVSDMLDWHDKKLTNVVVSDDFVCSKPYQRMSVWHDGKVVICDGNYFGKLIAGDLSKQSVEEVWNGPVMGRLRKLHLEGKSHKVNICAECGYRMATIRLKQIPSHLEKLGKDPYEKMGGIEK